jgi:pimeloyl-ACP methyl ester carboxylesterase
MRTTTRSDRQRLLSASVLAIGLTQILLADVTAQQSPIEPRTVDVNGASIEYIDFGGEGSVLLLITPRDAGMFGRIGPLLAEQSRTIAVSLPRELGMIDGAGSYVPGHAEKLASFMDELGIARAALVSNIGDPLVYIAEHYPQRVAGLVFLGGPPREPDTRFLASDPHRTFELWYRAIAPPGASELNLDEARPHFPRYFEADEPTMGMPALVFERPEGMRGVEAGFANLALVLVGSPLAAAPASQSEREEFSRRLQDQQYRNARIAEIRDPESRAFFGKLAADGDLQADILRYQQEVVDPVIAKDWARFRAAFADLHTARLQMAEITGYEYQSEPETVARHILQFLDEIGR